MQQNPLIAAADSKSGAGLTIGETFDVSQHDDLPLTGRQTIQC